MDENYQNELESLKQALEGIRFSAGSLLLYCNRVMPHRIDFSILNKKRKRLQNYYDHANRIYERFMETPEQYGKIDNYFEWDGMQKAYTECDDFECDDIENT